MSLFKCKMCGGELEIAEGATIAKCEYCGTKQTVPRAVDENLQNLFNRANTLRIKSEFDKAEKLYEKIIQADNTQSEAYWGLILCKYGIEYVDDPATFKKIPTCHRASYDSIIADDDYKSALANADITQRAIYEEQAREIDKIQKDILALAQNEETYDVFICYKETDSNGKRTQDSVIANDIYYQLKNEGFKVFYAAITLEGKLGSAYEPIIFAALNSAKVMLTIGTKPEYFNAVWVKNEWSRFLKIIQKDRSKLLIPCYRDMDAYELPEEFAHLQAQDMSKIGFITDLIRGIKKAIKRDEPKETVIKETVVTTANISVAPLLKRAFMFLEDGDFSKADDFCEQVLNQDPENAQAYLGKLMAELKVKTVDELKNQATPFNDRYNYQKSIRFATPEYKAMLEEYNKTIVERNEISRKDAIYNRALKRVESVFLNDREILLSIEELETISGYRDVDTQIKKLNVRLEKWYEEKKQADEAARIKAEEERLVREREAEEARIKREREAELAKFESRNRKKNIIIGVSIIIVLIVILMVVVNWIIPFIKYSGLEDFYYTDNDDIIEITGIKYKTKSTFVIPDKVASIGNEAFSNCTNLTSVTIGNGVKSIGNDAFSYCTNLTSITIPDSVNSIGDRAFYNCDGLTSVTISDSVISIGNRAFYDCNNLSDVTIGNSVVSIGDEAFYSCTKLSSLTIGNGVTKIGVSAFSGCKGLTSVTIPDSVISIESYAFYKCTALKNITIGNNVKGIGSSAFSGCDGLINVIIPNAVTSIGSYAFEKCIGLTSITIGSGVISIGSYAFYNCDSLTSVEFKNSKGWQSSTATSASGISASGLADKATAANYLTDIYKNYIWTRS